MLDGAARLTDLFEYTAELGMNSLATTDHGFVFGAFDFWSKAKNAGIKPIIGVEAYLTPGTARQDRSRVKWGDGSGKDVAGAGAESWRMTRRLEVNKSSIGTETAGLTRAWSCGRAMTSTRSASRESR